MAVDLPALLRPTKQTSGPAAGGSWSSLAAEVTKLARWRIDKGFESLKFVRYCIIDQLAIGASLSEVLK